MFPEDRPILYRQLFMVSMWFYAPIQQCQTDKGFGISRHSAQCIQYPFVVDQYDHEVGCRVFADPEVLSHFFCASKLMVFWAKDLSHNFEGF